MKKVILAVAMILAVMGGIPAYAADAPAATNTGLLGGNINLQGDTIFMPKHGQFGIGVGTTIATVDKDGILEVRGEAASSVGGQDSHSLVGIGVGVNIPKLIAKAGGQWGLKQFAVEIFAAGMMDMSSKIAIEPVIGLSIIKVNF